MARPSAAARAVSPGAENALAFDSTIYSVFEIIPNDSKMPGVFTVLRRQHRGGILAGFQRA